MKLFAQALLIVSLAFCWACAANHQGSSSDSGTVKMLTDEDYKRIGVKETGPQ
ncbi:MAG: hypothetical protein G3M78_07460 [Candidatus Nitrohelix vancouverensis]|uniref:Uncharacterized protein n=1 Tax=Candidatus Nitrohelix vancouverensis TaxID=2705534 RepID=A0A7T0C2A1_9BACT|nr:MAG: hypothetical protein G3M78_07460 [Candidatus Nitrohelix vancouverensis]